MKKYCNHILMLIMITSLVIASCKKSFLEIGPEASIDGSKFFSNQAEILQAVNGAYAPLRSLGLNAWKFGEMRSDNTADFETNTGGEQMELIDQFLITATNDNVISFWSQSYIGISRCNAMLDHVDAAVGIPDDIKKSYVGETKFLRAFYYFQLVRQFGGVPLRTTFIQAATDALSKGRATKEQIYEQILSDLQFAVTDLPPSYPAKDLGKATQGAALMLRAEVYMTQQKFTEALTDLRTLETLRYSLMPNYKDIFDPLKKNNSESIFEIQYLGSQTTLASNFMYTFAPSKSGSIVTGDPGTDVVMNGGWNTPTTDLINTYEPGDLRKDASMSMGYTNKGVFVNAPHVIKYTHGFVTKGQTNDNLNVYRYADALLMIAECLNETSGVSTESFDILDRLRTRAGLQPLVRGSITTQALLRLVIEKERRLELAFENHRWYDLVRTGKAVEVMNAHGINERILKPTVIRPSAFNVTQNNLLLPIPQQDVNVDNLEQNPQ